MTNYATRHLVLLAAVFTLIPQTTRAQATNFEILYSFQGSPDGANPQGGLLIGNNGTLYGTTSSGGASGDGTV